MTLDEIPAAGLGQVVQAQAQAVREPVGETGFAEALRRAAAPPSAQAEAVTLRAQDQTLSQRAAGMVDRLNEDRLTRANAVPPDPAPAARALDPAAGPDRGPTASMREAAEAGDPFERSVRDLKGAFHHAIEVELVAKTGSSLNSSMNKLMSGQ